MIQVKEIRTEANNLQKEINEFLSQEGITQNQLCDIKYNPGSIASSALIIYSK